MQTNGADGGKRPIPYVSFSTFETFNSDLSENGVPSRIDRSILKRFAGGTAGQLLTSLKAMGLMEENNEPTDALRTLVGAYGTERWKDEIGALARRVFAPLVSMDLENATPSQFSECFRSSFGGGDEVQRKGAAFFFHAAKVADIPIGPRILANKRPNSGPRKPRAAKRKKAEEKPPTTDNLGQSAQARGRQDGKSLAHELVDILDSNMTKEQQDAVLTIVLYLKSKELSGVKPK